MIGMPVVQQPLHLFTELLVLAQQLLEGGFEILGVIFEGSDLFVEAYYDIVPLEFLVVTEMGQRVVGAAIRLARQVLDGRRRLRYILAFRLNFFCGFGCMGEYPFPEDLELSESEIGPSPIHTHDCELDIAQHHAIHNEILLFEIVGCFEGSQFGPIGIWEGKASFDPEPPHDGRIHLHALD